MAVSGSGEELLGQEDAWEGLNTGVGDPGGLRAGSWPSPISVPALPAGPSSTRGSSGLV